MSLLRADEAFDTSVFANASCAFGVFDGLHTGHRYLIDKAVETKGAEGSAAVITFDIDPDEVFHPDRLKKLMRNEDRLSALERSGVDDVIVLPFVPELYTKSPLDFLSSTFAQSAPAHMHVGEDFRFGARAAGTVDVLEGWARETGCIIHAHHLVSADGTPITATRIRLLLDACDIREANRLLGRPYRMRGTVQKGRGEGTDFGFATANLHVRPLERVLGDGVYAAYAYVDGRKLKAAVSVGVAPTFESETTANVEAHLLDFKEDIVGKEIALDFIEFLRPMMKFETTEELVSTVLGNINWVRENL